MNRFQELHQKVGRLTPDEADEYERLSCIEDRKGGWQGFTFIIGIAAILACISQCSCTLTVHPDGRREYKPEPVAIARAIEILAEK